MRSALESWGEHVVRVALKTQQFGTHYADVPASHALAKLSPCAALVRPDRIVYGVAKLADAEQVLLDFRRFIPKCQCQFFPPRLLFVTNTCNSCYDCSRQEA